MSLRNRGERIIKRGVITIVVAVGLAAPAMAGASRLASGSTRTAIERAAGSFTGVPQRCLLVTVTTKEGGNWATVGFNAAQYRTCQHWGFNGVDLVHRAHGQWRHVTSGSAQLPCERIGVPAAVRRDLHLPCR